MEELFREKCLLGEKVGSEQQWRDRDFKKMKNLLERIIFARKIRLKYS